MSVCELSHRSAAFKSIITSAERDLRALLNIPESYKVLFVTGGGTGQFAAVPLNLYAESSCDYVISGTWSSKAATEAQKYCKVREAANFGPSYEGVSEDSIHLSDAPFVYCCTNETVNGVLYDPVERVPKEQTLIADMSSEILTRRLDVSRYGCIFFGAQKNVGIAGVTVVIVRGDLLGKTAKICPSVMNYSVMEKSDSLYNTPPTMAIYMAGLMFKWAIKQGGLETLEHLSLQKAALVYDMLEQYPDFYVVPVKKENRSRVNVVFKTKSEDLDKKFVKEAKTKGLCGLSGHRSVGGMRASLYNAITVENTKHLAEFIEEFAKNN